MWKVGWFEQHSAQFDPGYLMTSQRLPELINDCLMTAP